MIRAPRSDFWQVGVAPWPIASFLEPEQLPSLQDRITWLPDPGPWRYLADPFAISRRDATHVFFEAFDYRTKCAVIEHHALAQDLSWQGKCTALAQPFHLSYPYLVEHDNEVFMIPESHQAGEVALYRARRFPDDWVRETVLLPLPGAEVSVIHHLGLWWMFFTLVGPGRRDQCELHVAHASKLTGPWKLHPGNPVLNDFAGARPGGTPFKSATGAVILPVQDCSENYGGALRFLWFTALTPTHVAVERLTTRLTGDLFSPFHPDGCHTLSACGNLTFVDVKRTVRSWARHKINLQRRVRRLLAPAS